MTGIVVNDIREMGIVYIEFIYENQGMRNKPIFPLFQKALL